MDAHWTIRQSELLSSNLLNKFCKINSYYKKSNKKYYAPLVIIERRTDKIIVDWIIIC